ncbi:MAG: hypothetical protein M3069_19105 [Chloroflexota bacterium]|nr:hypothetical protein [Chloroflexota bacterium]
MPTIEWREDDYEAKLQALRAAAGAAVAAPGTWGLQTIPGDKIAQEISGRAG